MTKQYIVKGFIQNIAVGKMLPSEFIVSVSNDTHCTVSVAPNDSKLPMQYSVDFTKVLEDLKKEKQI